MVQTGAGLFCPGVPELRFVKNETVGAILKNVRLHAHLQVSSSDTETCNLKSTKMVGDKRFYTLVMLKLPIPRLEKFMYPTPASGSQRNFSADTKRHKLHTRTFNFRLHNTYYKCVH